LKILKKYDIIILENEMKFPNEKLKGKSYGKV
jgi:hypothetical protein